MTEWLQAQLALATGLPGAAAALLLARVLNIAIVVALTLAAWALARRLIRSRVLTSRVLVQPGNPRSSTRAVTLSRLMEDVARYALVLSAGYLVLREIGLDLTPVLASVGVVGIAISLGAQSLVRDILTGVFLLFEDQLHVGDAIEVVGVAGAGGIVEDFGLRATKIRDVQGELHFVPNGQIGAINRFTRGYVTYFVDLRLPDGADRAAADAAIGRVAAEVARQIDLFVRPPRLLDAAAAPPATARLVAEIVPLTQWVVEKELAPRAQAAAAAALGAEVPPPTVFRLPEEVLTYRRRLLGFAADTPPPA